jgi:hypothetical protein
MLRPLRLRLAWPLFSGDASLARKVAIELSYAQRAL